MGLELENVLGALEIQVGRRVPRGLRTAAQNTFTICRVTLRDLLLDVAERQPVPDRTLDEPIGETDLMHAE